MRKNNHQVKADLRGSRNQFFLQRRPDDG